jgi:Dickkopf-like protein
MPTMKNLSLLGLAVVMTSMLGGCELYFGSHDGEDHWNYCGSDGFYDCTGDQCSWVSQSCPTGTTGSGSSGYECSSNTDCAAGCYCDTAGTCEEAGFCSTDKDCGQGYHCDTDRASCEPNPPQPTCGSDTDCGAGSVCTNGTCTATCACATDADATSQGYGYCDETRGTCMTGTDPAGSCGATLTCATPEPTCAAGQTALILNGCWTGECRAINQCSEVPACTSLEHEADCLDRTAGCSAIYSGQNCHTPTGGACHAGDTNCTCSTFSFDRCVSRTANAAQLTNDSNGNLIDISSQMN